MAIYIQIRKIEETNSLAVYEFTRDPDEGQAGQLRIDKSSGDIREMQSHPDDTDKRLYVRAARKVFLHHQKGEYPENTSWSA